MTNAGVVIGHWPLIRHSGFGFLVLSSPLRLLAFIILPMSCKVSRDKFGTIVESALAELPEPFASFLEEVPVEIRTRPSASQLREAGLEEDELLFGLYVGHPRTERSVEFSGTMPDVIYIFQEDHELACDREADLAAEIRKTVLHEIGHHFGMDEDDLDELGYG